MILHKGVPHRCLSLIQKMPSPTLTQLVLHLPLQSRERVDEVRSPESQVCGERTEEASTFKTCLVVVLVGRGDLNCHLPSTDPCNGATTDMTPVA